MRYQNLLLLAVILLSPLSGSAQPRVVVSIVPLHSLVANVMQDVGEPVLLIKGGGSPHDYALRPSDVRVLGGADVVFWMAETLESFLVKPLRSMDSVRSIELLDTPGLAPLPMRAGGVWQAHEPEQEAQFGGVRRQDYDPHVWLDPRRAGAMANHIAAVLSDIDPANAGAYARNAGRLTERLGSLETEIAEWLAPVRDVPYIVFHDAYQYFEHRFATNAVGSITVSPERLPGARRIVEIRAIIRERGARCIFREPQFRPALVGILLEDTDAVSGVLDPLGTTLEPGPDAYFELLHDLADSLRACLDATTG